MPETHPLPRRTFLGALLASAVAGTAAACGFAGDDSNSTQQTPTSTGGGAGTAAASSQAGGTSGGGKTPVVIRNADRPITNMDPAIKGDGSPYNMGLLEGLVLLRADGEGVLPGVAESWTTSDDGLVYTFKLRAAAKWSNGDQVTADDFVWNWKRGLSPETFAGTENTPGVYGARLDVAGAQEFSAGTTKDFSTVGVKAKDPATLEITLARANPDFIIAMTTFNALPMNPKMMEEHPDDWLSPKNWVGNGPFMLADWQPNASITLVRNDSYWDTASYEVDRWEVRLTDGGTTAMQLAYQSDEIDMFRVEGDTTTIANNETLKSQIIQSRPFGYQVLLTLASKNTTLYDVRVRKALSMAIDRTQLAEIAWPAQPGPSLVPSTVVGSDKIPQVEFDPDQARQLLAEAGYPDGKGMPTLTFLIYQPTPWIEAVGGMWKDNLNIETKIDSIEVGAWLKKRLEVQPEDYVGFSYGSFGVSPVTMHSAALTPLTNNDQVAGRYMLPAVAAEQFQEIYLDEQMPAGEKDKKLQQILDNDTFPEWKKCQELLDKAVAETDPEKQQDLLVQAAIAREESYCAIPCLWSGYVFLAKPRVHNLKLLTDRFWFYLKGVSVD